MDLVTFFTTLEFAGLHVGQIGLLMMHYVCTQFFNTLRHLPLMQVFCLLIIAQHLKVQCVGFSGIQQ